MNKNEIIKKMSQAIKKAEERGMSGAAIELLLAHFKKDYNLSDEEFKEYQSQACSMINESKTRIDQNCYYCSECGGYFGHGEPCDCRRSKKVATSKSSTINDTKQKKSEDEEEQQKSTFTNDLGKPEIQEEADDPRTWLRQNESYEFLDESTKAQLKKAEETLNDPNSSNNDRSIARAIIDKHNAGKKAAEWKSESKKVLAKKPAKSKITGENLNKYASQDYDRFGEFHIDNGKSKKRNLLKAKGMTDDEIAEYNRNKDEEKALEAFHKDDLYKKKNEQPIDRAEQKRRDDYDFEETEIYANANNNEATQFLPFISGLHDILESSRDRKYFLNYLKEYKLLSESVLDPINKERCSDIFKGDKMLPKVRSFILEIVNDFKKQINFPINIKNIYMIGSSTGYQYTITSDIDLEIETDLDQKKFNQIFKIIPKGVILPGTERPFNIFILKNGEKYDFDKAENVYDVMENKFVKISDKIKSTVPYQYIKDLSTFFMNGCELALNKFDRDVQEMKEYLRLDPETMDISENEKHEAITRKLVDLRNDVDVVKMAHHVLFAFEKEGYEDMPFKVNIELPEKGDPRYSVNNLVYKMVDKFGYLERLDAASKEGRKLIQEVESKYGK